LLSRRQHWQYRLLVVAWVIGQLWFWRWWLQDDHVVTLFGIVFNSVLLSWAAFLPAWFLFFLGRARQPNPHLPVPAGRVAMVVTRAPSEPWTLVRKTLLAMLAQDFPRPYDVWLADEDPSVETRAWCATHAVRISCRKGVYGYHNRTWPRREKSKEGNLAYFYEVMGGYHDYEFVSQLDADHVPEPTYLTEMVRPFADPTVGYVAAPSMCDSNADQSWAARGRLYAEAVWHGAVQAGFNGDFAPQCIGSHYAVRTRALEDIGGLGPELAEDFSTTLLMNSAGWRGAFALNAFAHGDGPASLADCITQEFQWSRSVVNIFLSLWFSRHHLLPLSLRIQLGFAQGWYFAFTLHLTLVYLLPVLALLRGTPWVRVELPEYLLWSSVPAVVGVLILIWTRRQGWLRPTYAPVLSWEAVLFEFVRWPWMLLGIGQALIGHLTRRDFAFRVTPKGVTGARPLPGRILLPYLMIVVLEAGAAVVFYGTGAARGYVYLALLAAVSYLLVIVAIVGLQIYENGRTFHASALVQWRGIVRTTPTLASAAALVALAVILRGDAVHDALAPTRVALPQAAPTAAAPSVLAAPQLVSAPTAAATSASVAPEPTPTLSPAVPMGLLPDQVSIGAYDPDRELVDQALDVEHWFIPQSEPLLFANALDEARNRRTPLVTIEPWPSAAEAAQDVLETTVSGGNDDQLRELARVAQQHRPQIILIRWAHEMELSNVYPWGARDAELYRRAFRHVVSLFRDEGVDNLRFVWSPAGETNALDYYPGGDVVDYVGLTALEDEAWDATVGLPPQSFDEVLGPRYRRVAALDKPVIVAELGVSGGTEHQAAWLSASARSLTEFPRLTALVYFDARNPPVHNGLPVAPDWHISGPALQAFLGLGLPTASTGRPGSPRVAPRELRRPGP
jgi:cellulose synthase (UDP-forming)